MANSHLKVQAQIRTRTLNRGENNPAVIYQKKHVTNFPVRRQGTALICRKKPNVGKQKLILNMAPSSGWSEDVVGGTVFYDSIRPDLLRS